MSTTFVMTSTWWLASTPEPAWEIVADASTWPRWWRPVRSVGGIDGDRARRERAPSILRVGTPLGRGGLQLRIATLGAEPFALIELLVRGDLDVKGTWVFSPVLPEGVDVTCRWELRLPDPWSRRLRLFVRLWLERSHFALMRSMAHDMGHALACRVTPLREWSGPLPR